MSIAARKALVASPNTIFQRDSQRSDLLDPTKTQTELIAALRFLIGAGHIIEFTAIRSDHHDDSGLNPTGVGTHARGWAADCWPLASTSPGDYVDAGDARFAAFLQDCAKMPFLFQIGLGGSADTSANQAASGDTCFSDNGGDHIHLGTQP